jgi:hypothetical protein
MDWGRLYPEMAALVGLDDWKPRVLDRETMLGNCAHFVDCLLKGDHYTTPSVPREEYDRVIALLREVEWSSFMTSAPGESDACCPICEEWASIGRHARGCSLAEVLRSPCLGDDEERPS